MSYQVLARKWRPKNFEQLVGQELTARALINALDSQRLHHALLFTGTRGVGKTTIARIFSKSLNCEQGISSNPCGQCSSCTEIDEGRFVDLMEIDAASKTGIDDMRELIDNVQYKPTRGRYKVYLIDEVHMLSTHSFNALLKTLEEPPPHVIFLLATTDPQKLPITVLSRCLQFHLRRMEPESIISHLSMVLKHENISFDIESLAAIAKGADGSMRDALSLLDQAIVFSGDQLKIADVLEMLGSIEQHFIDDLLHKMIAGDAQALVDVINKMAQFSPDYIEVMNDWLSLLHQIAVAKATGKPSDRNTEPFIDAISAADLQLFYQLSLQAKKDLPFAPNLRQGFEMAMLRVLSFKPNFYLDPPSDANPDSNSDSKKKSTSRAEATQVASKIATASEKTKATQNNRSTENNRPTQQANSPIASGMAKSGSAVLSFKPMPTEENKQKPLADVIKMPVTQAERISDDVPDKQQLENAKMAGQFPERDSKPLAGQVTEPTLSTTSGQKIALEQINEGNWPQVIAQFSLLGTALQILRNSLPNIENNSLTIRYSEGMSHLLTDKIKQNIEQTIYSHFSDQRFDLIFKVSSDLEQTPKERQAEQQQASIETIQKQLLGKQCIQFLLKETSANLVTENISLKSNNKDQNYRDQNN